MKNRGTGEVIPRTGDCFPYSVRSTVVLLSCSGGPVARAVAPRPYQVRHNRGPARQFHSRVHAAQSTWV